MQLGLRAEMPVYERWNATLGLQFSQKGYLRHIRLEYNDPDYQYDEITQNRVRVQINSIAPFSHCR